MSLAIRAPRHQEDELVLLSVIASTGVVKPPLPQLRKGDLVRISPHSGVVWESANKIELLVPTVLYSTGITNNIRS